MERLRLVRAHEQARRQDRGGIQSVLKRHSQPEQGFRIIPVVLQKQHFAQADQAAHFVLCQHQVRINFQEIPGGNKVNHYGQGPATNLVGPKASAKANTSLTITSSSVSVNFFT